MSAGSAVGERRLHALVIGVDHHDPSPRPGGPVVPHLGGCVRDARRVETFLRHRLGVPAERIEILVSPNPPHQPSGGYPADPPDASPAALPTLANLLAAFDRLAARAAPGDAVLVHFSGHGTRVRTAFPQWKGDGRDEALVPCDAAAGEGPLRVLRDLELAALLRRLAARDLEVNLVLDCCHSGGAVRGEGIRCLLEVSAAGRAAEAPRLPAPELEAAWGAARRQRTALRAFDAGSGWLPSRGVVLLAACAADEYAWEHLFAEGRSGVLTHCLLEELALPAPEPTWRRLADRLVARVHGLTRSQTPQIEGDMDRRILAAGRLATPWAVRVLAAGDDGTLLLDAGRVHGVGPGSRFALADGEGHAEVTTAEAVTSRAVLRQAEGQAPAGSLGFAASSTRVPSPGDLVLPLAPRPCLQRAVAAMPGVPAALAARVEEAAEQLASGFLRWPAAATGADFLWGIDRDGRFEVRDAVGTLLRLEPPLSASSPSAARHLVARLDHLARYRNVEALENHDPRSSLAGRLELGLGRLPAGYQHGDALDDEPLAAGPGVATVQAGEWICLRIHNRSDRRLHVALLDLTTSWAVRQITAGPAIGGAELVDPRGSLAVPLQASVPAGYPEVRDVLKVLAAPRATSFRWLELPPLDGTVHRAHREPPADALERLFAAVSGTAGPGAAWRDVDAPPPRDDWTSARIVVRVMS